MPVCCARLRARRRRFVRVRRVQGCELGERADPAPERAAEAVRVKLAAQQPRAVRIGRGGCAAVAAARGPGRGAQRHDIRLICNANISST